MGFLACRLGAVLERDVGGKQLEVNVRHGRFERIDIGYIKCIAEMRSGVAAVLSDTS